LAEFVNRDNNVLNFPEVNQKNNPDFCRLMNYPAASLLGYLKLQGAKQASGN
jgi:hypothetical protein